MISCIFGKNIVNGKIGHLLSLNNMYTEGTQKVLFVYYRNKLLTFE